MHDSDSDALDVRNARNQKRVTKPRSADALVCSMSFTVSAAEGDELHRRARRAGLTFSAWCRQQLGLRAGSSRKS